MQSRLEAFTSVVPTGTTSSSSNSEPLSINWSNTVLAALFLVGTGGIANPQAINRVSCGPIAQATGTSVRIISVSNNTTDVDRLLDVQEKLAGIRRYLSMNVTDIAKVLRVARPTVYSWFRDESSLRGSHLRRVEAVYKVARQWRRMSSQPVGEFLSQPLVSGESLLDLLSAKALDEVEIQDAFGQIQRTISRSSRRVSVVDVARKRGFKLVTVQPSAHWSSNEDVDL